MIEILIVMIRIANLKEGRKRVLRELDRDAISGINGRTQESLVVLTYGSLFSLFSRDC